VIPAKINNRWELMLPEWRAEFHAARPHWEAARLTDMHARLKPRSMLFDIGSEEGDLTTLYASWGHSVYWFEPVAAACRTTIETLGANALGGMGSQTFVGNINRKGTVTEEASRPDPGFAHLDERDDLPVMRLDDFPLIPDALTIDVEGSELEVLKGAVDKLEAHHPMVWVSIHPDFMIERYGQTPEELHDFMETLGYRSKFLAFDHEEHWRFDETGGDFAP
jgi:FkbM family methyltransferase